MKPKLLLLALLAFILLVSSNAHPHPLLALDRSAHHGSHHLAKRRYTDHLKELAFWVSEEASRGDNYAVRSMFYHDGHVPLFPPYDEETKKGHELWRHYLFMESSLLTPEERFKNIDEQGYLALKSLAKSQRSTETMTEPLSLGEREDWLKKFQKLREEYQRITMGGKRPASAQALQDLVPVFGELAQYQRPVLLDLLDHLEKKRLGRPLAKRGNGNDLINLAEPLLKPSERIDLEEEDLLPSLPAGGAISPSMTWEEEVMKGKRLWYDFIEKALPPTDPLEWFEHITKDEIRALKHLSIFWEQSKVVREGTAEERLKTLQTSKQAFKSAELRGEFMQAVYEHDKVVQQERAALLDFLERLEKKKGLRSAAKEVGESSGVSGISRLWKLM